MKIKHVVFLLFLLILLLPMPGKVFGQELEVGAERSPHTEPCISR
jgi:hypothetical protein